MQGSAFTESAAAAVTDECVLFGSSGLQQHGILSYAADIEQADGVLVVPPHPHFAGNMDNNVVKALGEVLAEAGFIVLRFNYRGVGESEIDLPPGTSLYDYWEAVERLAQHEPIVDDAAGAARYLLDDASCGVRRIHVVGYSFGAVVGCIVAGRIESAASAVAICTPWKRRYDLSRLHALRVPKLFVNGKDDFVFDRAAFETEFAAMPDPKMHEVLGEDHFFRGEERELAARVTSFIKAIDGETCGER